MSVFPRFAGLLVFTMTLTLFVGAGPIRPSLKARFNGRWRIDTNSFGGNIKPTIFKLDNRGFSKDDDIPTVADGRFHYIKNDGYVDEQSVSVKNRLLITEVDKLRSKIVYKVDYVISPDGKKLSTCVVSFTSPNGQAIQSEALYLRKNKQVVGGNLITGVWERTGLAVDAKSDWLLDLHGNRFSRRTAGGLGYNAIIGGASVKMDGDNSGSRAKVSMPMKNTIVETGMSAKGKWEDALSLRLLPDGNTILAKSIYDGGKSSATFYLHRVME